jgi:ABC-type uncharacterized transport system YnjBCD ATPase subunit
MNFDIRKGEVFGFLGPSGAGKTTTQRLIIGLLRNYTGQIEVLGKERNRWGKDFYEQIGVAFDFPNLYIKLTAKENLQLIGAYYKIKMDNPDHLLDRVGLFPDKDVRVESFSKGMKMRLNFIRSIMHQPDLMFVLPCFSLIGFPYSWLFTLVPSVAALRLMLGAYLGIPWFEAIGLVVYLVGINYLFLRWTKRVFENKIIFQD